MSAPVLLLDAAETSAALDLRLVIEGVRTALIEISRDAVAAPPRIAAAAPAGLLGCMPAFVPGLGLGAKLVSVFDGPGGRSTHLGLVALFDEYDGRPLAIMSAGRLTAVRTAASATVAWQALAPSAERIAVIGAGVQAQAQLEMLALVAPAASVVVGVRSPAAGALSIRDAVRGADAVFLCTGADSPVISFDWLGAGTFVSSVGGSNGPEVDPVTIASATVYVEWPGAALFPPPAGAHELQDVDPVVVLGSLLDSNAPPSHSGRSVFKSTGHAALDVAAAAVVHQLARERGLGRTMTF